MTGIRADTGTLQAIQGQLDSARARVDGLAGGLPGPPDAGELAGPLSDLMAQVMENVGHLSESLSSVSDAVQKTQAQYHNDDDGARAMFDQLSSDT